MGCCGGGMFGGQARANQAPQDEVKDLQAVLKERLVRGEITVDEYERIRAILAEEPARPATTARPRQMAGG